MADELVRDWMTPGPITVSSSSTLPEAYWLMMKSKVHRLPVMEGGRLVGIVTLEDLRRMEPVRMGSLDLIHLSDMLSRMPVWKVMTKAPVVVSPDLPLVEAAALMLEKRISTLPVMEDDSLVGILTDTDILRAFVKRG